MVGTADWRWQNVPVPEPHVAGLLAGAALHVLRPWPLPADGLPVRAAGVLLVATGLAVAAWSVVTIGAGDVTDPDRLVTDGPYRFSRHPMYVAWTALYVGASLVLRLAWPLALLPLVAAWTHRAVRREERALEARFGEDYVRYRRAVRRYL